jgi:cytochrome b6-f complex iron-sulfur subunit
MAVAKAKETTAAPRQKMPINRREFLNFAWLASLGFLTVNMAGMSYLFAMPRFRAGEFGGIYTIGPASELPTAGSPPVNYPKVKLWLSNTPEGVMALYKVCNHLGCLYNWNDQEVKFICPCHGSQFEANGDFIQGPAPRNLDRFVVQAVDPATGEVVAETDLATGGPLPLPSENVLVQVDTGQRINGQPHG